MMTGKMGDRDTKEEINKVFQSFNDVLVKEQETKEAIRKVTNDIDLKCRQMKSVLHQIHSRHSNMATVCAKAREYIPGIKKGFAELQILLADHDQATRYRDNWKQMLSQFTFLVSLIEWLESGALITQSEVEALLCFPTDKSSVSAFNVELVDYLYGLCFLPNELARLCVTRATMGDYPLVENILRFVNELFSGFQLLNLKNDFLRKKYDSIKYDLKKIEEVVYDLSIRGLLKVEGVKKPEPKLGDADTEQRED